MVFVVQQWIFAALALALFVTELWAFLNAVRYRPDAYLAASKRTKSFWMLLTGLAVLLGFLSLPWPIGGGGGTLLFMIAGIVIAGVFLADVLPALRAVMGRASGSRY